MPGPITSKELQGKLRDLPEEVFRVFNDLIKKNWDGSGATVIQKEAADRIAAALDISRQEAYDRHLLDVESAYRKAGWKVVYDKPAYCETYEASFRFSRKKKS